MAKRIKSGLKRRRQNEVRRLRNRAVRTRVRNAMRDLRTAITGGDAAKIKDAVASHRVGHRQSASARVCSSAIPPSAPSLG